MEKVKIKIVDPQAVVPYKKYDGDFCYDCVAVSEEQVAPNVWKYGLGFALQRSEHTKGDRFRDRITIGIIWLVFSLYIRFELNRDE